MKKRKYIRTPKDCPDCRCRVAQRSAYVVYQGTRVHPECWFARFGWRPMVVKRKRAVFGFGGM